MSSIFSSLRNVSKCFFVCILCIDKLFYKFNFIYNITISMTSSDNIEDLKYRFIQIRCVNMIVYVAKFEVFVNKFV